MKTVQTKIFKMKYSIFILLAVLFNLETMGQKDLNVKLVTLDPGHFHAALVQKTMLKGIDSNVSIYAPEGKDLNQHLARIAAYNARPIDPTFWKLNTYVGNNFFEEMIRDKPGDVVVMAGNNAKKTSYIYRTVEAKMNVLADKPMCIDAEGFKLLQKAFVLAQKNQVLLYDIMTERSEINTILQKELSLMPEIFGKLVKGTLDNPSIVKESIHHFYKNVSGSPLIRPEWFMDTQQQGEGIVDVTTHLVDLVQWAAYPNVKLKLTDSKVLAAKRWPTKMTASQFQTITGSNTFPDFLKKDVDENGVLNTYANGQIDFKLKDVHARVKVLWNFEAESGGDAHYSIMRGTKANLEIRQTEKENFIPQLFIKPLGISESAVIYEFEKLRKKYPEISLSKVGDELMVNIPQELRTGHEAHFGEVMERYLDYLKVNRLPSWEVPNMLSKYKITTTALKMAELKK